MASRARYLFSCDEPATDVLSFFFFAFFSHDEHIEA